MIIPLIVEFEVVYQAQLNTLDAGKHSDIGRFMNYLVRQFLRDLINFREKVEVLQKALDAADDNAFFEELKHALLMSGQFVWRPDGWVGAVCDSNIGVAIERIEKIRTDDAAHLARCAEIKSAGPGGEIPNEPEASVAEQPRPPEEMFDGLKKGFL